MPVGTVRGRFELDAPALRTLKDLEKQGVRTQAQMKRLGDEMDRVGGTEDARRLQQYGSQLGDIRRTADRTARDVSASWVGMTRVVKTETARQGRAIDDLILKMDRLGAKTARPSVDLSGISAAMAQVQLLESRLDALGRRRVTPNVSIGGGFGGGGGRVPSGGGGGGRAAGQGLRSVGFGPFNLGSRLGLGLIGAALPAGVSVLGSAGALAGSAGMGALGAGALGAGAFGAAATGIGSTLAVAKPAFSRVGETYKAQQRFDQAQAQYGAGSSQARTANAALQVAYSQAPAGTRPLLRNTTRFTSGWDQATQAGQASVIGAGNNVLRAGIRATPFLARAGNRSSAAVASAGTDLANFAAGSTGRRAAGVGSGIFAENIPAVERSVEHVARTLTNIMQASRPFIRETADWIDKWTKGWSTSTSDITKTRGQIGEMVDNLKSWARLAGSGGNLLKDLLGAGAPAGQSMVERLTATFDRWDAFVKGNPQQVSAFFDRTVASTEKMAAALTHILTTVGKIGDALLPLLDRFSDLAGLAGSLGLGTPGVASLAFGAYRGMGGRGGARGAGGAAGGGSGAAPGVVGGGVGGGVGATGFRASAAAARRTTFIAGPGGEVAPATMRSRAGTAARGARVSGVNAARGAARGYAPVGALFAAAAASGTAGNVYERAQAGLSSFTLGLVPGATTRADARAQGTQAAQQAAQRDLGVGSTVNASRIRDQIDRLTTLQQGNLSRSTATGATGHGILGGGSLIGMARNAISGGSISDTEAAKNRAKAEEYGKQIRALNKELTDASADLRQRRDAQSVTNARQYGSQLGSAYRTYQKAGQSDTQAGGSLERQFAGHLGGIRDAGVQTLGQAGLDWANALAKKNPAMQGVVDKMTSDIRKRFKAMGTDISIVNGQILTGSKSEWGRISDAMGGAAERAHERVSAAFTAIQQQAVGSLKAMGFSAGQARNIVQSVESGGKAGKAAKQVAGGQAGYSALERSQGINRSGPGMRTGDGIGDQFGDGTGNPGMGGRGGGNAAAGGRSLMGASPGLGGYDRVAAGYGLSVTSGARPGAITASGNVSLHSSGNAIDESGPAAGMLAYAKFMADHYGPGLDELIHTPLGYGIKNGKKVPLSFWGATINAQHNNHVHVGDKTPGGPTGGGLSGGIGSGSVGGRGGVKLKAPKSGLGGAPGALADRAGLLYASGLQTKVNAAVGGAGGGGAPGGPGAGGTYNAAQLSRLWVTAGGPAGVADLMAQVALAESGGRAGIINSIGATGLWQIYNGNGAVAGATDPMTNARMAVAKYQAGGLAPWVSSRGVWGKYAGGFAAGGSFVADGATMFMAGERKHGGRESVHVRRIKPRAAHRALSGVGGGTHVHFHDVHVRDDSDLDRIAEKVGAKLLAALGGDQVPDDDIDGGG